MQNQQIKFKNRLEGMLMVVIAHSVMPEDTDMLFKQLKSPSKVKLEVGKSPSTSDFLLTAYDAKTNKKIKNASKVYKTKEAAQDFANTIIQKSKEFEYPLIEFEIAA